MAINILGFKISRKGITLPFSNVCISIPLILLAMQAVTSARGATFPSGGTFKEQDDFIQALPRACPTSTSAVVKGLMDARNPFEYVSSIPKNIKVDIYRHEYDAEHGMVTRRTATTESSSPTVTEREQLFIGGEGDGSSPLTFVLERTPEGNLKMISKEKVSVANYAAGIQEAQRNEGLAVSVRSDEAHCFNSKRP